MSNFEKVKEFNDAFNTSKVKEFNKDVFDTHPDMINLCLSLIKEEVEELEDALLNKDVVETKDALADILYVVYGMQYRLGIKGDNDFSIVHNSNMSKLCNSQKEAEETVEYYENSFKTGLLSYDTPYFEKLDNLNKWVVKNKSTGKVLKSINYTPVKWTD